MNRKDIIVYSLVFVACMILTTQVVLKELTGFSMRDVFAKEAEVTAFTGECTNKPAPARQAVDDPQLKALVEYEKMCGSQLANSMMIFTNMPVTEANANEMADKMTTRLRNFKAAGIQPLVIVEPDSAWGLVDFTEFAKGDYDPWIDAYFKRLKSNGITKADAGVWIPFPEPQQEYWNNAGNPDDFSASVNRYFKIQRAHIPESKTALLLDSETGEANASQLLAYTRLVQPELIDIVGVQGFPWHPSEDGDKRTPIVAASQFLPAYVIEEVAKSLGKSQILLNTGTYRHRLMDNGGETSISIVEREKILKSIGKEASTLKQLGYNVTINIFAENKINAKEGVDWSYWQAGDTTNNAHTGMFKSFVSNAQSQGIEIGLFDAR